jgi:para-nitrobenzyl esterase
VGRATQVLDVTPEVRPYPEEVARRLWEGYDFRALPLLK